MNQLFTLVGHDQVIVYNNGVYAQLQLYTRENNLYAGNGKTFIMLYGAGATSASNKRWVHIETDAGYSIGKLGRLEWVEDPSPGKARTAPLRRVS